MSYHRIKDFYPEQSYFTKYKTELLGEKAEKIAKLISQSDQIGKSKIRKYYQEISNLDRTLDFSEQDKEEVVENIKIKIKLLLAQINYDDARSGEIFYTKLKKHRDREKDAFTYINNDPHNVIGGAKILREVGKHKIVRVKVLDKKRGKNRAKVVQNLYKDFFEINEKIILQDQDPKKIIKRFKFFKKHFEAVVAYLQKYSDN